MIWETAVLKTSRGKHPRGGGDTSKESTYEYTNRVFGHVVGKFGGDYSRG